MAVPTSGREKSQNGPGWYDINGFLMALEKQHECSVTIRIDRSGKGTAVWGFRVTAFIEGTIGAFGCGSFGPAHPGNGQSTLAGATYHALLALETHLCRGWLNEVQVDEQLQLI